MRDRWSTKSWSRDSDRILRHELMQEIKKLQRKKRKAKRKNKDEQ